MENTTTIVIQVQRSFTLEDIHDILCAACEGGINSWVDEVIVSKPVEPTPEYYHNTVGLGGELKFYITDGDELAGQAGVEKDENGYFVTLDLAKLKKGLELYQGLHGIPQEIEDIDSEVAAGIVECACFGEVVFC